MNYRERLRKAIECPQFGNINYGEYGALRLEQRENIKRLLDEMDGADEVIKNQFFKIERLKQGYCELKEKCNRGECDCTHEEYDEMCKQNMEMDLEIERLNNIINELEKYIKESCWKDSWGVDTIYVNALLNKLQELKGDSSNGNK